MSELGRSPLTPQTILPDPNQRPNVLYNPSRSRLRALAREAERETTFGAPSYVSEYRSRSADHTRNAVDDAFDREEYAHMEEAIAVADATELVCIDRRLGRHPDLSFTCRLFVPRRYARIAMAIDTLLDPAPAGADPDFLTLQLPGVDELAIRILPNAGVTTVLGSDYTGEAKKSFLRLFMYAAKHNGGLGLHAGSKAVRTRSAGDMRSAGQLFLGLSATGKSTLTAHDLDLDPPEVAEMRQDDVCALLPDGTVAGSEGRGLYVKTHGLRQAEQPDLYRAVVDETAILENVDVGAEGDVDFESDEYTTNGRAVIRRDRLASASTSIDLEDVDQVFFITRNPLMPPVARLNVDEAAAAFMCGESIQTSAGDPSRAGEAVRVVGTNPFIIGPRGEEGNRFRRLVDRLELACFVLNTGTLGERRDIGVEDSVAIIRALARGEVTWTTAPGSEYIVPERLDGLAIDDLRVDRYVEDYPAEIATLREERRRYLDSFDELDEQIAATAY